ncbi:MAG: RNA 2',3'-cyclic phosphodiesterase [Hasllibacter sp.]
MRAFVGLPVPDPLRAALVAAQARLPLPRPVPEDDLHLTLAFLDDRPERQLEAFAEALGARRLEGCVLDPVGIAPFGTPPRLIAAEFRRDPPLEALERQCRSAAREAGIDLPRRRFRPHVTLARMRRSDPTCAPRLAAALAAPAALPAVAAERVVLWSSTLRPDGPRYDALADWPLPPLRDRPDTAEV